MVGKKLQITNYKLQTNSNDQTINKQKRLTGGCLVIWSLVIGYCLVIVSWLLVISPAYAGDIIWNGPDDHRVIALTFDDGPRIDGSPDILNILDKYGVKATFFVVGTEAEQNPDIVYRIYDYGHEVGNHFHSNERLKDIPFKEALSGIERTNEIIYSITGKRPKYFRPPGGKCPDALIKHLLGSGMEIIGWTINVEDYTEFKESFEIEKNYIEAAKKIRDKVLDEARPGAIVLLHNGSKQTILALPEIIERLRSDGYGFVTISELLEGRES